MRKQSHQKKNSANTMGSIRIIAGKHRGRKLPVLTADGLRPTTDRVKETLFNWLMPYVPNSRCLDCFAGAGSLGFEALSRGASVITLLELNALAAKQLKQNASLLKADNVEVVHTDSLQYLATYSKQQSGDFNLVFIDPPFHQGLAEKTIVALQQGWLAHNAIVYLEVAKNEVQPNIPDTWVLLKEKVAGQVLSRLYRVE